MMKRLLLALGLTLAAAPALAASCASYPTTLTNGTTADANQVMGNFNTVRNCVLNNAASIGANADITSLTGMTTPLAQSEGGTGAALTLGTAGQELVVNQGATALAYAGPLSTMKNRLVNGAMMIDQANEGASVSWGTGTNQFFADEWRATSACTFASTGNTVQQVAAPSGFIGAVKALKLTIGTGSATLNAGDCIVIFQSVEGQNVGDLAFGGSNAQPVSISLWLQSSVTGTFGLSITNSAANRSFVQTASLTANVANHVCLANIPGDTAGTWLTTNGIGVQLRIAASAGSTFQGTAGSWQGSNLFTTSSQTNLGATTGATLQFSEAQFEIGTNCTAFDARPFPAEVALAQRYFEKSWDIGTAIATSTQTGMAGAVWGTGGAAATLALSEAANYKATKRADPTLTLYSTTGASGKCRDIANSADVTPITDSNGMTGFVVHATANASATTQEIGCQWTADARL